MNEFKFNPKQSIVICHAEIKNMKVICHNLPSPSPVEGLLGLDFLKKAKAIIDFSKNRIYI